jgi:hypothetical protein
LTSNPKPSTQPDAPGNTPATEPIRPEQDTDKTGVTSAHNPTSATSSDKPTSSNDNSGPGAASVSADPSSAPQDTQKQQGADRPSDEPSSEEHDRIKETKEAEEAAAADTSGPGPRSLEEKARDGGVGGANGAGGGDKVEEEDGPQKESQGEGTGEKYVKSSGMVADGGDFDAANPGAGKEADRKFFFILSLFRYLLRECMTNGVSRSAQGKWRPSRTRPSTTYRQGGWRRCCRLEGGEAQVE